MRSEPYEETTVTNGEIEVVTLCERCGVPCCDLDDKGLCHECRICYGKMRRR